MGFQIRLPPPQVPLEASRGIATSDGQIAHNNTNCKMFDLAKWLAPSPDEKEDTVQVLWMERTALCT